MLGKATEDTPGGAMKLHRYPAGPKTLFGGWAASLVDALDSLWIMGLHDEFEDALQEVEKLDFTSCSLEELNVFETTIRYLGGLLAAYDVSRQNYPVLLRKAVEIGQMLYVAFDTPNRMPITRWRFHDALKGAPQEAGDSVLVAEIGSLTLEFTRLSQLTNDDRYFDAVQRIMNAFDSQQHQTKLPGMWPIVVNAKTLNFHEYSGFTIGGMADSLYEYLPKQHILLGGGSQQYRKLYQDAMVPMKEHIFFRPMTQGADVLFPGDISSDGQAPLSQLQTEAKAQHLSCFAGGMVALGARVFDLPEDLDVARKLVDGCLWGYETGRLGIMPEIIRTVACGDTNNCVWDEDRWHREVDQAFPDDNGSVEDKIKTRRLAPGITKIDDGRYILRPEAIESVFILYRITGDQSLAEKAWTMFETIVKHTISDIAHAGLDDCTVDDPPKQDRMESFWMAETLKYFYLIFSDPRIVSLDEYVLNTEAHPLKRTLNDLIGFIITFIALRISSKGDSPKELSFGWQRAQLLGAFFNGVFLLALGVSIVLQSFGRFISLQHVESPKLILIVGCVGLGLNIISASFLHEHDHGTPNSTKPIDVSTDERNRYDVEPTQLEHHEHRHHTIQLGSHGHDLGMMGALMHVLSDAVNNVGVIISALVIWLTHNDARYYADPAVGMAIGFMILISSISLIRRSGLILLESVPTGVDLGDVQHDLEKITGVLSIHELHIWRLNQQKTLASVHVVISDQSMSSFLGLAKIINECFHAYGIHSTTLQPELLDAPATVHSETEGSSLRRRPNTRCQVICGTLCEELTCCG
ncbi:endoplasmic reticulum mannosyl-oligosaccharide 1,2-alpha-mannosidase, putative [Paecilomyces variotii No. 5]|uniref:alpha-1,2-Mannosidase n=1 Tax=Byssochlamys spectabilis (strain No. 5 / NBRC 109023) TaxID=1356009 RepID=V5G268_BYSSN|nr:endoplasmic reticulum mannosyl-oligosaccharide 1,2-alpha-mannosidase, putative [Paecilomyces variotii No. 5]